MTIRLEIYIWLNLVYKRILSYTKCLSCHIIQFLAPDARTAVDKMLKEFEALYKKRDFQGMANLYSTDAKIYMEGRDKPYSGRQGKHNKRGIRIYKKHYLHAILFV